MKASAPGQKYAELRYQQLVRIATSGFVLTERERAELARLVAWKKAQP